MQARPDMAGASRRCRNTKKGSIEPGAALFELPPARDFYALMEQRDAIDRVAQIDEDDTAARLIEAAVSADDETMVRALLHGAYRYRWHHTVSAYAEGRPEKAAAAMELWMQTEKEHHV
nr:hypothetical protein [Mycobacteroides abscessus]